MLAPHAFCEAQNMGHCNHSAIVTFTVLFDHGSSLDLSSGLVTNLWANQAPSLSSIGTKC